MQSDLWSLLDMPATRPNPSYTPRNAAVTDAIQIHATEMTVSKVSAVPVSSTRGEDHAQGLEGRMKIQRYDPPGHRTLETHLDSGL